jgi:hypothetical protein
VTASQRAALHVLTVRGGLWHVLRNDGLALCGAPLTGWRALFWGRELPDSWLRPKRCQRCDRLRKTQPVLIAPRGMPPADPRTGREPFPDFPDWTAENQR